MIDRADYPHPVSELLDHGPVTVSAAETDKWFDYVGHYGLGEMDMPLLIDLIYEDGTVNPKYPYERYAPTHACRALGQLGDMAAGSDLVQLLDDDENDRSSRVLLSRLPCWGLAA